MIRHDWMSAATAAARLQEQYQGWTVGTVTGFHGVRIAAVRDDLAPGVHAVVGTYTEVRAELEKARRSTLRAAAS